VEGIILINKPKDYTSQDVVSKVKKILNIKKAGHTGTLDPMATGLLPVMLGNYTKLSKYLIEHDKTYVATLKLGMKTDTGDITGKVIEERAVDVDFNKIEEVLKSFLGKQMQIPPMYSAIKIDGKKLYEYAREGKSVSVPPREIEIYKINLININIDDKEIKFSVACSKGTYIRVLCENIAEKLNTVGTMSGLERVNVDMFNIIDAVTFEQLEENKNNPAFIEKHLLKMEDVLSKYEKISLDEKKKKSFLNGVLLSIDASDGIYNITINDKYIGTGTVKNKMLKRDIIMEE